MVLQMFSQENPNFGKNIHSRAQVSAPKDLKSTLHLFRKTAKLIPVKPHDEQILRKHCKIYEIFIHKLLSVKIDLTWNRSTERETVRKMLAAKLTWQLHSTTV